MNDPKSLPANPILGPLAKIQGAPTDTIPLELVAALLSLEARDLVAMSRRGTFPTVYPTKKSRWVVSAAAYSEWLQARAITKVGEEAKPARQFRVPAAGRKAQGVQSA